MPLADVVVTLGGAPGTAISVAAPDLPAVYAHAHARVFERKAPDMFTNPIQHAKVVAQATELGVTTETYIFSCMLGHRASCPERRFAAHLLLSPSASKRVSYYRAQAAREYGTVDVDAVSRIAGDQPRLREELLDAEELFGGWIVGERLQRGGNGVVALFRQRELALSPYWLSVEPTYARWLTTSPAAPATAELTRHRRRVSLVDPVALPELRRLRSAVVPGAVARVLQRRGLSPTDLMARTPVTDAFKMWLGIGDALLQLRLLDALESGVLAERATVTAER